MDADISGCAARDEYVDRRAECEERNGHHDDKKQSRSPAWFRSIAVVSHQQGSAACRSGSNSSATASKLSATLSVVPRRLAGAGSSSLQDNDRGIASVPAANLRDSVRHRRLVVMLEDIAAYAKQQGVTRLVAVRRLLSQGLDRV